VAAAGLVVALGVFLMGRRTSPDDLRAAANDLQALVRENAAGVKERAETLAQMPRISWAVGTDEATVKDLTSDELAFQTHPGEHIEITQMRRDGGEPRRLLRRPADSNVDLPLIVGTHVVVRDEQLQLVTVVSIEPRERAEQMFGLLAVAKQIDASAITQRLAARRINAEVRTMQGSFVLAGSALAPAAGDVTIPLTGPGTDGLALVGSNVSRSRWPSVVAPLVLILSLAGAALLWRDDVARLIQRDASRFKAAPRPPPEMESTESTEEEPSAVTAPHPPPPAPEPHSPPPAPEPDSPAPPAPAPQTTVPAAPPPRRPTPPPEPPPLAPPRPTRNTPTPPGAVPPRQTPIEAYPTRLPTPSLGARLPPRPDAHLRRTPPPGSKVTPLAGLPSIPAEAVPLPVDNRSDLARSGHVDTSLVRTGSVALPARGPGAPGRPTHSSAAADPNTEEYRSLFTEFVKMRKTTGEPTAELDAERFIETLREKRAQIMKQIPVKDVRFKLAFHNGKAAIRYSTVS